MGLVAFFAFMERGGSTVINSADVFHPGLLVPGIGTIQWFDSNSGSGLKFTSTDSSTYVMSTKVLAPPAVSVFARYRPDSLVNAYTAVMSTDIGGTPYGPELMFKSNGKLASYICDSSGSQVSLDGTGSGVLTAGQWATTGFSYNSVQFTAFFNGTVDAMTSTTNPATSTLNDLKIGNTGFAGRNFNGVIEWVGVWDRIVSADEAKRLFTDPFSLLTSPGRRIINGIASGTLYSDSIPLSLGANLQLSLNESFQTALTLISSGNLADSASEIHLLASQLASQAAFQDLVNATVAITLSQAFTANLSQNSSPNYPVTVSLALSAALANVLQQILSSLVTLGASSSEQIAAGAIVEMAINLQVKAAFTALLGTPGVPTDFIQLVMESWSRSTVVNEKGVI